MKYGDYEIKNYNSKFVQQIANLERHLWGRDIPRNIAYFRWKYEENPVTDEPVGMIALYKGRVVGFRGCFVTQWAVKKDGETVSLLSPADICVHPDHRRKGLFAAMTEMIIDRYQDSRYAGFVNLSSNKLSVPGYLKMGWKPLTAKKLMRRYGLNGYINSLFWGRLNLRINKNVITAGRFGNIEITDIPKAGQMGRASDYCSLSGKRSLKLFKDQNFFNWRFRNNRRRYIFYYYRDKGAITGYVVIRASRNNENGHIVDYCEKEPGAVEEILRFIVKNRQFDMLTVWDITLDEELSAVLKKMRFGVKGFNTKIIRHTETQPPILVRPLKKEYTEDDWFIRDVDMRDISNWDISEICSDAC